MKPENVDFEDAKVFTQDDVASKEDEEVVDISVNQIDRITRAEIDIQVATAHRFPRSISNFKQEALSMATIDEETAASCFYKLSRAEGIIEGPGVRLAEIVGSSWGNMRYGARIIGEDNGFIVAQGVAHDLEKNVSSTIEVRRRITKKNGKRYNADMIGVTANAACSIALRNAIFKVIPKTFVNEIYLKAKETAIGNATTLVERRSKAFIYFMKMGVTEERILSALGKEGVEDVGLEDLEILTGLKTAIKDGDTSVDATFPPLKEKKKYTGSDKAVEPEKKKPGRPKKEEKDKPGDMSKEALDADINNGQSSLLND